MTYFEAIEELFIAPGIKRGYVTKQKNIHRNLTRLLRCFSKDENFMSILIFFLKLKIPLTLSKLAIIYLIVQDAFEIKGLDHRQSWVSHF